jgi:protein ImuA
MGAQNRQPEVLEELRRQIRRLERRPARCEGLLACGRPEIEPLLPGGGFPRGSLCTLRGGPASGKTGVALAALREAQREGGLAAFVDGRGELYPPAAHALGVDLSRLLLVRPGRDGRGLLPGLWAAEVLLGSGAFPAVAVDVPLRGVPPARAEPLLRRLRAAAEKGGAVALLLSAPGDPAIPAAIRIDLDAVRPRPPLRPVPEAVGPGAGPVDADVDVDVDVEGGRVA